MSLTRLRFLASLEMTGGGLVAKGRTGGASRQRGLLGTGARLVRRNGLMRRRATVGRPEATGEGGLEIVEVLGEIIHKIIVNVQGG